MGMEASVLSFVCCLYFLQLVQCKDVLLIARATELRYMDLESKKLETIPGLSLHTLVSAVYDPSTEYTYWTDSGLRRISRARLNGTEQQTVVFADLNTTIGLALDSDAGVIYWTDLSRNVIERADVSGKNRQVVLSQNSSEGLDQPRDLFLHKQTRRLFWTSHGLVPKIESITTQGDNRITLVNTSLSRPEGLTIDDKDKLLYWSDPGRAIIEYANLDGTNRKILIVRPSTYIFGIAIYGDNLYWTNVANRTVEVIDRRQATSADPVVLLSYMPHVMGLAAVPGPSQNQGSLLVVGRTEIREVVVDVPGDLGRIIPLANLVNAIVIAYDPVEDKIYWTDGGNQMISRANRDGSGQEVLFHVEVVIPDGIAVSVKSRQLFWTDTGTNRIEAADLDGNNRQPVITNDLDEPRAIALDEENSMMYFSDWSTLLPRIERATFTGTDRVHLVNTSLIWPNGLVLDLEFGNMYWVDGQTFRLETAKLDGSQRMLVTRTQQGFSITLIGDYLYWTDWTARTIERINRYNAGENATVMQIAPVFTGLATAQVDVSVQEPRVDSLQPPFGPVSGGTKVVITGRGFLPPVRSVWLGMSLCTIISSSVSSIVVETPRLNDEEMVNKPLSIRITFSNTHSLTAPMMFTYRTDPRVTNIYPLKTIPQGGITLTIEGSSLNSVADPMLNVTTELRTVNENDSVQREMFFGPCEPQSFTSMHCITPDLNLPAEVMGLNTTKNRKRDTGQQQITVTVYIGLMLDGVPTYRNISDNEDVRQFGRLYVEETPSFPDRDQQFKYEKDDPITIQGTNMKICCEEAEYTVEIGNKSCIVDSVTDITITCYPPSEKPAKTELDSSSNIDVVVGIGRNLRQRIGRIKYDSDLPSWAAAVISVAVLLIVALVVCITVVIIVKKHAQMKYKKTENWPPAHANIPLPPVPVENLDAVDQPTYYLPHGSRPTTVYDEINDHKMEQQSQDMYLTNQQQQLSDKGPDVEVPIRELLKTDKLPRTSVIYENWPPRQLRKCPQPAPRLNQKTEHQHKSAYSRRQVLSLDVEQKYSA